jgi:hypothetical protein
MTTARSYTALEKVQLFGFSAGNAIQVGSLGSGALALAAVTSGAALTATFCIGLAAGTAYTVIKTKKYFHRKQLRQTRSQNQLEDLERIRKKRNELREKIIRLLGKLPKEEPGQAQVNKPSAEELEIKAPTLDAKLGKDKSKRRKTEAAPSSQNKDGTPSINLVKKARDDAAKLGRKKAAKYRKKQQLLQERKQLEKVLERLNKGDLQPQQPEKLEVVTQPVSAEPKPLQATDAGSSEVKETKSSATTNNTVTPLSAIPTENQSSSFWTVVELGLEAGKGFVQSAICSYAAISSFATIFSMEVPAVLSAAALTPAVITGTIAAIVSVIIAKKENDEEQQEEKDYELYIKTKKQEESEYDELNKLVEEATNPTLKNKEESPDPSQAQSPELPGAVVAQQAEPELKDPASSPVPQRVIDIKPPLFIHGSTVVPTLFNPRAAGRKLPPLSASVGARNAPELPTVQLKHVAALNS